MKIFFLYFAFICASQFLSKDAHAQISADYYAGGGIRIGPSTTTCDGAAEGAIRYNDVDTIIEYCDGADWLSVSGSLPSTDCLPDAFSFTDLTEQSLSSTISSETLSITGIDSGCVVSVSGAGSPEISVNGGAWGSSTTLNSGDNLQVRQTSSGTESTGLTATVTIGVTTDDWVVTTRSATLKVFRSSNSFLGNAIGGLSSADVLCQNNATSSGYAGTYKAILSDETTDAKDRLTLSYPIVRASGGATVAATDLWSGTLTGSIAFSAVSVWTGTNSNGTKSAGNTCDSWTGGASGRYGSDNQTSGNWTANSTSSCSGAKYIYCIQQ